MKSLLWDPSNSLVNQTHDPELHPHLQLAGWGFGAWSEHFLEPERPLIYKRPVPAFYDDNAKSIIPSLRGHTLIGQVRASGYHSNVVLADEHCHPFSFQGTSWTIAHNGAIPHWRLLQRDLLPHCDDKYLKQMRGATDTEFFYVLLLSLLKDDSADSFQKAFERALQLILAAMKSADLVELVKLKIVMVSPHRIMAANYGSGSQGETQIEGDWKKMRKAKVGSTEHSLSMVLEPLYFSQGKNFNKYEDSYQVESCPEAEATTLILGSEALTEDGDSWKHLNFGEMLAIARTDEKIVTERRTLSI